MITNGPHNIPQWNKYFKEFKQVNISMSDAMGKRYEYILIVLDIVSSNVLEWNNTKSQ